MNIGRPKNKRFAFASSHPQFRSHLQMKWTSCHIPVLVGPQIPRKDRENTRERYCRAILTLFRPWEKATDLCRVDQSWTEALKEHETDFDDKVKSIIANIEALHECKSDREGYLMQVLNDEIIDDFIPESNKDAFKYDDEFADEDDDDDINVMRLIDLQNEFHRTAKNIVAKNAEDLYIENALIAMKRTDRFVPKRDTAFTRSTFIEKNFGFESKLGEQSSLYYIEMSSLKDFDMQNKWLTQLKFERNKAREELMGKNHGTNGLIGEINNETEISLIVDRAADDIEENMDNERICVTMVTSLCPFAIAKKISNEYNLNEDQNRAFMIIVNHVNGQSHLKIGIWS